MQYEIRKATGQVPLDGNWDAPCWRDVTAVTLTNHMGEPPKHRPNVQAKVQYDPENLHVIWRVEDRWVRAVAQKHQDPVCRDSCVEFFFIPADDLSVGYFNLEVNCGGTILCSHHRPGVEGRPLPVSTLEQIPVYHSLPRNIDPERADPVTWFLQYRVPYHLFAEFAPVLKPAPGVIWRANFYKCADHTSMPHWLTWSPVDWPKPRFHLPEFFGQLKFA